MRSRIAIFEGYAAPFGRAPRRRPAHRRMGFAPRTLPAGMGFSPRTLPAGMGAPLFQNPRVDGYGRIRSSWRVPAQYVESPYAYGPRTEAGDRPRIKRRGYTVKATPAMKRAQARMKKAAKKCSRRRKGSFQACMKKALKSKKSKR